MLGDLLQMEVPAPHNVPPKKARMPTCEEPAASERPPSVTLTWAGLSFEAKDTVSPGGPTGHDWARLWSRAWLLPPNVRLSCITWLKAPCWAGRDCTRPRARMAPQLQLVWPLPLSSLGCWPCTIPFALLLSQCLLSGLQPVTGFVWDSSWEAPTTFGSAGFSQSTHLSFVFNCACSGLF